IPQILGDMAAITLDHLSTCRLVGPHHRAPVFRVEPAGEHGGVHQVTEQHCELAALGLGRTRLSSWLGLVGRWDSRWGFRQCASVSRPDEHGARLVDGHLVHLNEFLFQRFQGIVIQVKLEPESPIGQPSSAAEQVDHLIEHRIEIHYGPSPCASTASAWGSQNVISIVRYNSMAVASSLRACSRWPSLTYSVPRPRWQWAWSGRISSSSARASAWR